MSRRPRSLIGLRTWAMTGMCWRGLCSHRHAFIFYAFPLPLILLHVHVLRYPSTHPHPLVPSPLSSSPCARPLLSVITDHQPLMSCKAPSSCPLLTDSHFYNTLAHTSEDCENGGLDYDHFSLCNLPPAVTFVISYQHIKKEARNSES
jgi:hypothetical protein